MTITLRREVAEAFPWEGLPQCMMTEGAMRILCVLGDGLEIAREEGPDQGFDGRGRGQAEGLIKVSRIAAVLGQGPVPLAALGQERYEADLVGLADRVLAHQRLGRGQGHQAPGRRRVLAPHGWIQPADLLHVPVAREVARLANTILAKSLVEELFPHPAGLVLATNYLPCTPFGLPMSGGGNPVVLAAPTETAWQQ